MQYAMVLSMTRIASNKAYECIIPEMPSPGSREHWNGHDIRCLCVCVCGPGPLFEPSLLRPGRRVVCAWVGLLSPAGFGVLNFQFLSLAKPSFCLSSAFGQFTSVVGFGGGERRRCPLWSFGLSGASGERLPSPRFFCFFGYRLA